MMKKKLASIVSILMATVFLLNGCVSPPVMSDMRINIPYNYSRSILNLQNASNLSASWLQWSERLMKNGFLDTSSEEYGYFEVDLGYRDFREDMSMAMYWLTIWNLGITYPVWAILGIPTGEGWCTIYASLKIYDSNKNLIKSYSESKLVEKYAGLYYSGDMTKKVEEEFENLFEIILDTARMDSSQINRALRDAGPVTAEKKRAIEARIAADRKAAAEREASRPIIIYDTPSTQSQPSTPQPQPTAPSTPTLQTGRYAWTNSNINMTMTLNSGIVSAYLNNSAIGVWHGTYRTNGNRLDITVTAATGDYTVMRGKTYSYTITSDTSFSGVGETWVRTGSY